MRYLLCLVEQGLVSLLNIGLTVWLIRVGGSDLFGVYAFWFNVALLAGSVQYGLTICHLTPLPPGPGTLAQRIVAERALLAASLALAVMAAVIVAAMVGLGRGRSGIGVAGAIAFVPAYLAYQYARALAFSRGGVLAATLCTAASVALIVAGLAVQELMRPVTTAGDVLLIAALGYGAAGGVATWYLAAGLQLRPGHLRQYLPFASTSRWSLLGIVCFEMMNRLPGFAVTGALGASALGRMSSTQIPSRPPMILVAALLPALRNNLAELRDRGVWSGFSALTAKSCAAALLANAAWAVPVGFAWPLLSRLAFHGRFAEDLGLGLLWSASQSLGSMAAVSGLAFQVCGAFRRIGYADLAGAGATVLGLAVLLPAYGIAGTIVATIFGQSCYFIVVTMQWTRLRASFPQPVPTGAF